MTTTGHITVNKRLCVYIVIISKVFLGKRHFCPSQNDPEALMLESIRGIPGLYSGESQQSNLNDF